MKLGKWQKDSLAMIIEKLPSMIVIHKQFDMLDDSRLAQMEGQINWKII
jgi:hypothetical protein